VQPVAARGSWQSVEDISFEHSKANLAERCQKKIGKLAAWVKQHPTMEVALSVRADEALTGERDSRIATERLRAVREALIAEGVAPARIHDAAFEPQRGACRQTTSSCYERNRRVEVFVGQRY
jgi:peptidoglycan-associated lipoprotein